MTTTMTLTAETETETETETSHATTYNVPTRTRRPLISGVLRAAAAAIPPRRVEGFSPAERQRVRAAAADGRDVRERTIDHVVEGLLKELTW